MGAPPAKVFFETCN